MNLVRPEILLVIKVIRVLRELTFISLGVPENLLIYIQALLIEDCHLKIFLVRSCLDLFSMNLTQLKECLFIFEA